MKKNHIYLFLAVFFLTTYACKDNDGDDGNGGNSSGVKITVSPVSKFEGDETITFEFKVRLSEAGEENISVDYATEDRSAVAGEDYVATNGTLTFAPSETLQSVFVEIIPDTLKESDEEFAFTLLNPVNATLEKTEEIGTIRNDDTFLVTDGQGYTTPLSYPGV